MNHEPQNSATTTRDDGGENVLSGDSHMSARTTRERRKKNRLLFNKKRAHFLKDHLRNLDLLIYAELAAIYYMDCSFTRFIIRTVVQFMFLTPKPSFLPEPPHNRPYLGAVVGSNMFCLFLHVIYDRPAATEATRGYLHGGLAMDFIGQKGPTSKIHLVALDILLLLLQLVALGTHMTHVKVKHQIDNPAAPARQSAVTTTATPAASAPTETAQDLEHEEQGLLRSDHHPVDIELETLNSVGRRSSNGPNTSAEVQDQEDNDREALLASSMQPRSDSHIFDAFNSGEIMILDMDIVNLVRTQLKESTTSSNGISAGPSGQVFYERLARGGLGTRFRIGQRTFGV
ncbi:hypothetical protein AAFC00_001300 [Neodothiora populina]|uniref:DUF1746 domain-containing protein n=1 Tax=Neodothiora populina TaxID=2781224 RepID=A0ABR3PNN4_9PEZI